MKLTGRKLTIQQRAERYNKDFPKYPPLVVHGRWLYGNWTFGQNYKGSGYYGAYPPTYLKRLSAVFPEMAYGMVLHLFSGSLDASVRGVRVDINPKLSPDVVADARKLDEHFEPNTFDLIVADTPYSAEHATRYNTSMPARNAVFQSMAKVVKPGGHVAWLDTKMPMFRKSEWLWWGAINLIRSTNHDFRDVVMFERK